MAISPGVYTKIIDLSNYVQEVPASTGFICALCDKGRDNELRFLGGRSELIGEFGEPNIQRYGKMYGQGLYEAYNFLGESGSLYFMRCLPDDATYSNLYINAIQDSTTGEVNVTLTTYDSLNSVDEIDTNLQGNTTVKPICVLYPIGRGEYYNNISVRITPQANPMIHGVYVLDIYEKQSDGDEVIIESFHVSFDASAKSSDGESAFIVDVLNTYSKILRAKMTLVDDSWTPGYSLVGRQYDSNIGNSTVVITSGSATLTDPKQNWTDWASPTSGQANYYVSCIDERGNKITGWLGPVDVNDPTKIAVYDSKDLTTATQNWIGDTTIFDASANVEYWVSGSDKEVVDAFTSSDPIALRNGSDGSLFLPNGDLSTTIATQILSQGYSGVIDDKVLDTEDIYFNLVFDCGYPADVKTEIANLVNTRRDCVAICDNSDNPTPTAALDSRNNVNTFNSKYISIFEGYNKIYDEFSGGDVWVSPNYHLSYLVPRNDRVGEVWYAVAGLNRGTPTGIKQLRYNPKRGERDQFYLNQINPLIKLNGTYVFWSQLTSQRKPSALQDLNIIRLVLYCQRALEQYCRFFIFEQNDQITWDLCKKPIVGFLNDVKNRRGLYKFSVDVGASEYEKKHKTFHVNCSLNPTRTTEKIDLNFFIH